MKLLWGGHLVPPMLMLCQSNIEQLRTKRSLITKASKEKV
ncbi:hypothetical protein NSP_11350 [Nodularia spumigena CCY9414]|nr:hypothetical protein NSP_11350 [Nodularia spumigena CCY9414]